MATTPPDESNPAGEQQAPRQKLRWSTQSLTSSYANLCNATSRREEVVLNFGIGHNWERTLQDTEIELAQPIVLSPFAAKRRSGILHKLIGDHENRHGERK